jgi:DNA polymerase elongation subunit (family B)
MSDPYTFQIVNWYTADISVESSSDDEEAQYGAGEVLKYAIKLFGVDDHGKSISASIMGFTPYFFIKTGVPWSKQQLSKFESSLRFRMGKNLQQGLIDLTVMRRKDFWGFTNNQKAAFVRLRFHSHRAMKNAARVLNKESYALYESNIEPFLRFAHIKDIQPAGWITIAKYDSPAEVLPSKCEADVQAHWTQVEACVRESIAPLLVASFDLECMSSDGDFPVAIKNYRKMATDIYNYYNDQKKKKLQDDYAIKKGMVAYFKRLFDEKLVAAKDDHFESTSLDSRLEAHLDHICAIIRGDRAVIDGEFEKIFLEHFYANDGELRSARVFGEKNKAEKERLVKLEKKLMDKPRALIQLFKDKRAAGTSSTAVRKYMTSCFLNCFAQFDDLLKKDKESEDTLDELLKLLFGDKDGVLQVLTRYMNPILPRLKGDEIIQIGTTFHRYGSTEIHEKIVYSKETCDALEGITVVSCDSEKDMLMRWAEMIERTNPDVMTGYNIFGFDFQYLHQRAMELGCVRDFCATLTRLKPVSDDRIKLGQYKEAKLSSSALGDNLMKYIEMEGRTHIDLMKVVQREHKLDSYKLDAVANHFMKMNKHDVSPQDIFRLFRSSSKDRAIVADYCVQDCALCNQLVMKLEIIANNMGMANVCSVPMSWIFMRGQGVKIFSLVAKECKNAGFLVPVVSKPEPKKRVFKDDEADGEEEDPAAAPEEDPDAEEEGYEGAIVLEPKTGIHIDTPISVLDYASLYPSSMISENLSHDAIVLDPKYDNLPGVEYLDISYDVYEGSGDEKKKIGEKVCRFVQPPDGNKGVIPNILMHLLRQRKLTRKKICLKRVVMSDGLEHIGFYDKDSGVVVSLYGDKTVIDAANVKEVSDLYNAFQKAVLDGLQLAYKITANSLYGQLGAGTSPLYMKSIAACTTATGRKMIMLAKDFVEEQYQAEVIYGDSVTGDTPLIIRSPEGLVDIRAIGTLIPDDRWRAYPQFAKQGDQKEQGSLNAQVWSNGKWAEIRRVIRHRTAKRMYRVNTFRGCVDVTEDHSLVDIDGYKIKPKELTLATQIKHTFPTEFAEVKEATGTCADTAITAEEAWVWGVFFQSGKGDEHKWAIRNLNAVVLDEAKKRLETVEHEAGARFEVVEAPDGAYELVLAHSSSELFRDETGSWKVPATVVNASWEVRMAFLEGCVAADQEPSGRGKWSFSREGKLGSQGLFYLMKSVGLKDVRVSVDSVRPNTYHMFAVENAMENAMEKVTDVLDIDLPEDGFVYDIETSEGVFHGGIGEVLLVNTDSIFIAFPQQLRLADGTQMKGTEALEKTIELGIDASKNIKHLLKAPHDLEYEKSFHPMILFSKKRYCANKYEQDVTKFKQVSMGIALKRRDNANIVKTIYGGIIDIILNKHDIKESINFLQANLASLVSGKFPMEELVITKTLKAHYKDPDKIAHKMLADRIKERSPGNAPQANDRIPYVYVQMPDSKTKVLQGERIEHPDYIREKDLKPDYAFYLTNQVMNPVLQLYALVLEKLEGYRKPIGHWDEVRKKLEKDQKSDKKIRETIQDMREKEVKALLFDPILRTLENTRKRQHEITHYFCRG